MAMATAKSQSNEEKKKLDVENCKVTVKRVLFCNEEEGFAIIQVERDSDKGTTFVTKGHFGSPQIKDQFIITGNWEKNDYGTQLTAQDIAMPSIDKSGILNYMVDGHLKGIGAKTAQLIYDTFGDDTYDVLNESPDKLLEVKGIGKRTLEGIKESWEQGIGKRSSLMALRALGIPLGVANRIIKKYRSPMQAVEKVKTEPYSLSWEVKGMGFIEADKVARFLGFDLTSIDRLESAVGYVLKQSTGQGHCFLYLGQIIKGLRNEKTFRDFNCYSDKDIELACSNLVTAEKLVQVGNKIYLKFLHESEQTVANSLLDLDRYSLPPNKKVNERLQAFSDKNNYSLHELQKEAVIKAVESKISVITGRPGTGKTTLIKALLSVLPENNIALTAPTGRAAKKMQESTGKSAQTIHRLLGFSPMQGFEYNANNPLPYDFIIVDEASMLDVVLGKNLIEALSANTQLVLVGDVDQLPPVGAGRVFADMIESNRFPVLRLEQVFRQSEGSFIALNAIAIRDGNMAGINLTNKTDDFFIMEVPEGLKPPHKDELIHHRLSTALDRLFELGAKVDDIQILSPMRKGLSGVDELNKLIQARYNSKSAEVYKSKFVNFRVGDRVMQCRNNYDKDIFNGDLGTVTRQKDKGFCVDFDGREIHIEGEDIGDIQLAYATTIHKAQGSESKYIIQIISRSHYLMLNRSLIYTGITRARQKCILIGEKSALHIAVNKKDENERNTNLVELLSA